MNQKFESYKKVHHVKIDAVHHAKLHVTQTSYSEELGGINDYLLPDMEDNFEYRTGEGWFMRYKPLVE